MSKNDDPSASGRRPPASPTSPPRGFELTETKFEELGNEVRKARQLLGEHSRKIESLLERLKIQGRETERALVLVRDVITENEKLREELAQERDRERREALREVESSDPHLRRINKVVLILSILAVLAAIYLSLYWR